MIEILLSAFVVLTTNVLNMNGMEGAQKLELSIKTEKSNYAAGETVFLEIGLRNQQKQTIKVLTYFMLPADDPDKNNLEIHVYDANGNRLSRVSHISTGRALYYPEIQSIDPGETYWKSFQLAGTFTQRHGRKKVKQALWSFGEDPEMTSVNEYPPVTPGTFSVQVIYQVTEKQLVALSENERSTVWKGRLISNTIEISIT